MDPFAARGAGNMEELRRAEERKRMQDRINSLEGRVKELEAEVDKAKAAVPAKAAQASNGLVTTLEQQTKSLKEENAALKRVLETAQREVDERDAQWRQSVTTIRERYVAKAAETERRVALAAASVAVAPAAPTTAPIAGEVAQMLRELFVEVRGLKSDVVAMKSKIDTQRVPVYDTRPAPPIDSRVSEGTKTAPKKVSSIVAAAPLPPAPAEALPAGLPLATFEEAEPLQSATDASEGRTASRGRGRGRGRGTATARGSAVSAPTNDGTASAATTTRPKRGRPPKEQSADDARIQQQANELRKQMIAHYDAAHNPARSAPLSDDLIGEFLKRRTVAGLSQSAVDDLAKQFVGYAQSVAESKSMRVQDVLAEKFLTMLASRAASWREANRADNVRVAMLSALGKLAFQSAFTEMALRAILSRFALVDPDAELADAVKIHGPDDATAMHEIAACAMGWIPAQNLGAFTGAYFDVALSGLKALRENRDRERKRTIVGLLVAVLRGFSRVTEFRTAVQARRATLTSLMIQLRVTQEVHDNGFDGDADAWWPELCDALEWPESMSADVADMCLNTATVAIARGHLIDDRSVDAVLAIRIAAQSAAESKGVKLLYSIARSAEGKVTPPMGLLVASLCLDFDLQFRPGDDDYLAGYLASCFKGAGFVEQDTPAQIIAATAIISCTPVPAKASTAQAAAFAAAVEGVRKLTRKQQTVGAIRPVMSTIASRRIVAAVDKFLALPR
jgi:hypothetical protein